jgi:hypothetical protein
MSQTYLHVRRATQPNYETNNKPAVRHEATLLQIEISISELMRLNLIKRNKLIVMCVQIGRYNESGRSPIA